MHSVLHVGHHGQPQGRDVDARERGGGHRQRNDAAWGAQAQQGRHAALIPAPGAYAGEVL